MLLREDFSNPLLLFADGKRRYSQDRYPNPASISDESEAAGIAGMFEESPAWQRVDPDEFAGCGTGNA